jgi:4-(2-carboxyphenyl)-2-oxobut-3-enoate aldolase
MTLVAVTGRSSPGKYETRFLFALNRNRYDLILANRILENRKMRITVEDIVGVVGIVPTPATADAGSWSAVDTIDYGETEKMVRTVIADGIEILMTTGTFGECATLTWEELRSFVECVVQMSARRVPVFAGITTLNTRDTIQRAKALIEVGADGLFLGRPMWLPMDQSAIVRFYRDVADALPGVPLVVYDNPHAFKGKISANTYRELAKIKEIVAAKHVGGPSLEADLLSVGQKLRLLPLEVDWCGLAMKHPTLARACWSGHVACAPAPIARLSGAIARQQWEEAKKISEKLSWAISPMFLSGDVSKFLDYSIQLGHVRFEAAGLINPGPTRPPYRDAPEDYVAGSRLCGQRWATLQREFKKEPVLQ